MRPSYDIPLGRLLFWAVVVVFGVLAVTACSGPSPTPTPVSRGAPSTVTPGATLSPDEVRGTVAVDGSSTVFPITEAVAEEFQRVYRNVRVTVGISGTGGGFKKFCAGETDISDASRPIKQVEIDKCRENGVEFVELPVAFDGLTVVVNPENDWVDYLTVEELRRIWEPGAEGVITRWNQVRPEWPDAPLNLYGPGVDSGTYDYFTEAVVGEEGASRGDYVASEDDNVLVQGVAGDRYALGFFGYAYYAENSNRLRAVPVDGGNGPVAPSEETISNGTYQPLSRPIFIYVSSKAMGRPEVKAFVEFYLTEGRALVPQVGYVRLPDRAYELALERFRRGVTGSVFSGGSQVGVSIEDILKLED